MGECDLAIVGAGMAGASLAAEVAPHASVLLMEAEDTPGYHTTGRSAAFWEECYGGPDLVPLTLASGAYLRGGGFLTPRGALYIGQEAEAGQLDAFERRFANSGARFERLATGGAHAHIPQLGGDWREAIWQPHCADIDVAGLHQHYLRTAKQAGATLETRARIARVERVGHVWHLHAADGRTWKARAIANAAGAWADGFARMAGARPLDIQPLQRTMLSLRTDPALPGDGPLTLDILGRFYFKPESAGRLWFSPHDETPVEPGDAAPEELAVAQALDRIGGVLDCGVERLERTWAGLRSFAPDRLPVYGWDPHVEGYFWFAGQGGFGIQTAPAAARLAAQMFLDMPSDAMTDGIDAALYAPGRFG